MVYTRVSLDGRPSFVSWSRITLVTLQCKLTVSMLSSMHQTKDKSGGRKLQMLLNLEDSWSDGDPMWKVTTPWPSPSVADTSRTVPTNAQSRPGEITTMLVNLSRS